MSEELRKAFPKATFIPFNPAMIAKMAKARKDPKIETIIIPSTLKDFSMVPENGKIREEWVKLNTIDLPILELGCQSGHLYRDQGFEHLDQWYGFDLDVWKIDHFTQGDIHKLPFKDNTFATVCVAEILEHVDDPIQALHESIRVATDRILITVPHEHVWGRQTLPFMKLEDKNKLDGITQRQQIDKNSRWLPTCLNPKDYVATWDEEKYEHLWHKRHYYHPEDVEKEPPEMAGNGKPEVNFVQYLQEATETYDEKYQPDVPTAKNYHVERITYFPWGFLGAVIEKQGRAYMSNTEFKNFFRGDNDWYGQIFSDVDGTLIGFLRRV